MSYPIIRKGTVVTPYPTGYGASVERYQKRFSRKDVAKLQKKLAKYQTTVAKLSAKTSRFGAKVRANRIARLNKKIQAIQALLGMQPFDVSLQAEAESIVQETTSFNYTPVIVFTVFGAGLATFIYFKNKGK